MLVLSIVEAFYGLTTRHVGDQVGMIGVNTIRGTESSGLLDGAYLFSILVLSFCYILGYLDPALIMDELRPRCDVDIQQLIDALVEGHLKRKRSWTWRHNQVEAYSETHSRRRCA